MAAVLETGCAGAAAGNEACRCFNDMKCVRGGRLVHFFIHDDIRTPACPWGPATRDDVSGNWGEKTVREASFRKSSASTSERNEGSQTETPSTSVDHAKKASWLNQVNSCDSIARESVYPTASRKLARAMVDDAIKIKRGATHLVDEKRRPGIRIDDGTTLSVCYENGAAIGIAPWSTEIECQRPSDPCLSDATMAKEVLKTSMGIRSRQHLQLYSHRGMIQRIFLSFLLWRSISWRYSLGWCCTAFSLPTSRRACLNRIETAVVTGIWTESFFQPPNLVVAAQGEDGRNLNLQSPTEDRPQIGLPTQMAGDEPLVQGEHNRNTGSCEFSPPSSS